MSNRDVLKRKYARFIVYALFSLTATVLDGALVWVLRHEVGCPITAANTVGVTAGFLVHYLLACRRVFGQRFTAAGFILYLLTFLVGLGISNVIIWLSYDIAFSGSNSLFNFFFSKGISALLPFSLVYWLRVRLFRALERRRQETSHTHR